MAPRWQMLLEEPDDEEGASTSPDMIIEEAIDVPLEEAPLGRTLRMEEVRATTPEAPPGSDWLRGITGATEDPTGASIAVMDTPLSERGDTGAAINALAAGGVHGASMGLERRVPGLREWSVEAEASDPAMFAGGDMLQNFIPYTPANLVGGITRVIPAATKLGTAARFAGDVATQTGIGVVDSAARRYGDAGGGVNPEYSFGDAVSEALPNEGVASALMSLPTAAVGALGARGAARQATPEARYLRRQDYEIARLRSAGYTDQAIDELRAQPEKFGNVLSEIERLAAERGGSSYTIPQMSRDVEQAIAERALAMKSAAAALTEGGATVQPMDISDKIRADARASSPGAAFGTPASSDYVAGADAVAKRYADSPRPVAQPVSSMPGAIRTGVLPPPPPLPAGPLDEDPIGALAALSAQDGARAHPPGFAELSAADEAARAAEPMDILPQDLEPVVEPPPPPRVVPRSKALPPPPESMAAYRALGVAEPPSNMLGGERFDGRIAADPIGALAAQSPSAPPSGRETGFAALGVPDPPPDNAFQPVGVANPDPAADNAAFLAAAAARRPPAPPPYNVPRPAPAPPVPFGMEAPPLPQEAALRSPDIYNSPPVPASPQDNAAAFGSLSGVAPTYDPGPAPVPFNAYIDELDKAGQKIRPELAKPEDAYQRERYAAIDHAMDLGAERASPEMANQWADAKGNIGTLRLIDDQASATRHADPNLLDVRGAGLGTALAGIGSGLGYSLGAGALGASGLGALGLAAGMGANRWYQPRKHSITANWLSGDTADRMERLSGIGQKPVGSLTAGFGDLLREPPPEPEPSAADSGETSALSPGEFLGRDTTQAMLSNPNVFMAYANDYSKAGTDDRRAAVTERLYRTDPDFAKSVFPLIQGGDIA